MAQASLINRVWHYGALRFPLIQFVPLSLCLGLPAVLGASRIQNVGIPFWSMIAAPCALLLFFFRLRLVDELKDLAHDRSYYPDRPISRNLLSPSELRAISVGTALIEWAIAASCGMTAMLWFAVAFGYSLLTAKEFFLSAWLRVRFTFYILSHEALCIPLFIYLQSISGLSPMLAVPQSWLLITMQSGSLFLLEIARKLRAPHDEVGSRDTYSAQYGPRGAAALAVAIGALVVLCSWILIHVTIARIAVCTLFVFCIFVLERYARCPLRATARFAFMGAILLSLGTNMVYLFAS